MKGLLKDKLTLDEYELIGRIIDSTDNSYINIDIDKSICKMLEERPYDRDKLLDLPRYRKGKGLSLGAMTSQFLSIFYLSELDHFIVHDLHLKYMVHYMDDIVIIHHDKDYLSWCLKKIIKILKDKYKLDVNLKKTMIIPSSSGFTFLGYRFIVKNNKTIVRIKKDTIKKVRRRVREVRKLYDKGNISFEKCFSSINTYLYSFKYADSIKVKRIIEKYFLG